MCRPEQLRLSDTGVPARIRDVSYFGHDATVRLDVQPDGVPVVAGVAEHEVTTVDTEVRLTVVRPALVYPS
jgi:iron(III) transport system ATP-binding protein